MEELKALIELLWMLVADPGTGALIALLAAAAVIDWRSHRIPNWLTVGGLAYAAVFCVAYTPSALAGLGAWALGATCGLIVLLPLYLMRVLGAGDVKLMAMAGAFLGPLAALKAVLAVFIVGGVAALAFALSRKASRQLAANVHGIVQSALVLGWGALRLAPPASIGKLPYGVSIAVGTTAFLVARQLGYA